MNINIRKNIIQNFKNDNLEDIKNSIEASIEEQDEITLPGLGVFFEIIWKNSDKDFKNKIIKIIKENIDIVER